MAVNIEFLLTGHPSLLLRREGGIKGLYCGGVIAAIGGGAGDIHPVLSGKRTGDQFRNQKRCRIVTGDNETDILLFAADKAPADIISGVSEIDVYIVTHLFRSFKGMLDEDLTIFLPLVFR